jgi:hypothetical protein
MLLVGLGDNDGAGEAVGADIGIALAQYFDSNRKHPTSSQRTSVQFSLLNERELSLP